MNNTPARHNLCYAKFESSLSNLSEGGVSMSDKQSILESFILDEDVAELSMVDDLWYFIEKSGNWIVGSG